jgi:hypothetical protein
LARVGKKKTDMKNETAKNVMAAIAISAGSRKRIRPLERSGR